METKFVIKYTDGAYIEVVGNDNNTYNVKFYDDDTNTLIHESTMMCGYWSKTNRKYFTKWRVEVWLNDNLILTDLFDCSNKIVKITLDSTALGDKIAWVPYCEEFRKKHKCKVVVSCSLHDFFSEYYPNITWVPYQQNVDDVYSEYKVSIGIDNRVFQEGSKILRDSHAKNKQINYIPNLTFFNKDLHPEHPLRIPLQKVSSNILGLEWFEIRPNFDVNVPNERPINEKYICISEFASAKGMKMWNNPVGWKKLVSELKMIGYKIVSISKEKSELNGIINRNGDYSLHDRMWYLKHCEFFIGLGSGLSWLSWTMGKKVVMINGFSEDFCEFTENNIRVKNYNSCTGCFNSEKNCDKLVCYHWSWCPEDKNFECSRKISPKMVIDEIKKNLLIS